MSAYSDDVTVVPNDRTEVDWILQHAEWLVEEGHWLAEQSFIHEDNQDPYVRDMLLFPWEEEEQDYDAEARRDFERRMP